MFTIDVDDNDDCVFVENESERLQECEKKFNFKRNLISEIWKHRSLYDNKHKLFSNVDKKDLVWQQIATKLKSNVDDCKTTWFELRYAYQCHARNLRKYFINGRKKNLKRPSMPLETNLMFLWRFIDNRKTCKIPFEIVENIITTKEQEQEQHNNSYGNLKQIDDDLILVEPPVELIVIDEEEDSGKSAKQFKLNNNMKFLILQIKNYPELYDSEHSSYKDYARKSFVWNAIASNLGDKATKLMKCWIVMQTRYEWELNNLKNNPENNSAISEFQVHFAFFKDYILNNPDTVYKQSYYLKTSWYDPIDYFKDIYNLIIRMKKVCDIVYITDSLLKTPEKSSQYLSLWTEIAFLKNCSPGECETTWLILRFFYWELMNMRQQNYQLTDKWYFETIISELYAISKATQTSKQQELQIKQNRQSKKPSKRSLQANVTSQGAPASKRKSPIPTTTTSTTTTQMTPTIVNNLQILPPSKSTATTQCAHSPQFILPKITAAISLAPQSLNTGALQIKQIPGPPTLSPAPQSLKVANSTPVSDVSSSTKAISQLSLSYNLPVQTKMTPFPMPSLVRPVLPSNLPPRVINTHATISVRPRTTVRPSIVQPAPGPATKTTPVTMNINSVSNSPLTPKIPNNSSPATTLTHSIASFKITVPQNVSTPTTSSLSSADNNVITTVTTSTATNNKASQLPKITGAISLLNHNEILIELISSPNGNQLVVHGPPLTTKYQVSMPTLAKFIREVLAIPLLHNKSTNQSALINVYWEHISSKINLPVYVCRACWNFLLENFSHFPQIAPMKELMKPFQTSLNVWKVSTALFKKFDEDCISKDWLQYAKTLPDVVVCISGYRVLYQDVCKQNSNQKVSEMETLCAWKTISLMFPKIPVIQEIWSNLKKCFVQYMNELEFGTENKWPINWWRSLARLKFLVEARYSSNEPFYYIVTNKMLEEIDKCAMLELKSRYKNNDEDVQSDVFNQNINSEFEGSKKKENDIITSMMVSHANSQKHVEPGALVTAIQKYPVIYGKGDNIEKFEAWKKVAQELHMEVPDCLFAFKQAIEKYFAYKKQDPLNRFDINRRYYKKLDDIVRSLPNSKFFANRGKINIRTPFELNQSVEAQDNGVNCTDLIFPERYISDICMSNSPSNLVVKNWIYAIGNIPKFSNEFLPVKDLLEEYLPNIQE